MERRPHILLGITGSIAAVKGPRLAIRLATELKAHVKIVLTRTVEMYFWKEGRACETYDAEGWRELLDNKWAENIHNNNNDDDGDDDAASISGGKNNPNKYNCEEGFEKDWRLSNGFISVHYAEEEWNNYKSLKDPVLHIDLRNWADICIIAPLSAHTLAKIANGMCDDLLTCCIRAWDFGQRRKKQSSANIDDDGSGESSTGRGKPIILAPAMNTAMWEHPLTTIQLETIQNFSCKIDNNNIPNERNHPPSCVTIVNPAVKTLACGEIGAGALADLDDIILATKQSLRQWTFCSGNNDNDAQGTGSNSFSRDKIPKGGNRSLPSKKESMKKALLLFAKNRFREMQSSHQQQIQSSPFDTMRQSSETTPSPVLAAPISPTPNLIIETFLPYLYLNSDSLLIDLGCGDGRWLIEAAKMTNCKCLGIDVDEERLEKATECIGAHGLDVDMQVQVRNQDIFEFVKCDDDMFTKADVFVLYLFREAMLEIGPILERRLCLCSEDEQCIMVQKDVRIICVGFGLPGPRWNPIQERKIGGIRVYLYSTLSRQCKS